MEPYLGEVRMFGGTFAPDGWMLCDGAAYPIAQYEALFSLIGNTYGGDGVNTFAVPDLRGRVPIHRSLAHPIGSTGGTETVTLSQLEMGAHSHTANVQAGNPNQLAPAAHFWAKHSDLPIYSQAAPNAQFAPAAVGAAGGSQPHDNMMPFNTMTFIIAWSGLFPPQN